LEFRTIVGLDIPGLTPGRNNPLKEEVGGSPAMEGGHGQGFNPLGEGVYGYQEVAISIFVGREGSGCIYASSSKGSESFVFPSAGFFCFFWGLVHLVYEALGYTIRNIGMHTRLPIVGLQGLKNSLSLSQ
jgi:hypothetical protein